ncbi:MAG: hypothetical protein HY706_18605 [Candidatus Hydrogenedentes bacterium]|nr:hypothetical protein [Candidatus Hydrogenedentota bacterium]
MPYNEHDPSDPMMLVGVTLPSGAESSRDMAYVFAEEFARMGFSREQLLNVFREPFYAGAHRAYLELGEETIDRIVGECVALWGLVGRRDRDAVGELRTHVPKPISANP